MEIVYLDENTQLNNDVSIVSAIGFFDGLHLGHMALVDRVIEVADKKGCKKALMTFDHHPLYVLGRMSKDYYLTSMMDRKHILKNKGIDYLFVIKFSKQVAGLSPKDFIETYLIRLNIHHVVCGFDFHFGSKNSGNSETLKTYNPSILKVDVIDEVLYLNEKISSTRTRKAIEDGDMRLAAMLLNRFYKITGTVIDGRKLGRKLGFPTANINYGSYLLPAIGVYAVYVYIDNKKYLGMCNVGHNPTVGTLEKRSVEVHIIDFDEKIYDKIVEIEFIEKTRGEVHFKSQDELIQQLKKDKESIKNHF
ncbi:MAG: bifunctional riboflavin kinase/FAD synthetase [Bacilli bacterium]|nr:bifunctional riboflavin kinase/FAD synthetase [Bacilli bacterium]